MRKKRAVVVLVVWRNKVLLVKKGEEPGTKLSGKWAFPAETLEPQEHDLDAVHRGVLEEANLKIVDVYYLADSTSYASTEIGWYAGTAQNPEEMRAGSDADDAAWYKPREALAIYGGLPSHPLPEEVRKFLRII